MSALAVIAILLASLCLGWLLGKPRTGHLGWRPGYPKPDIGKTQAGPDEPWPRIPELDAEAGKKWEADQKRKEEARYARQCSKGPKKKGNKEGR